MPYADWMRFKIENNRQVAAFSLVSVVLSVVVSFSTITWGYWGAPADARSTAQVISVLMPLMIAGPISFAFFWVLKSLHQTIALVENHVKFDTLTGVLSRGHFLKMVQQSRSKSGFVLFCDTDNFKSINDRYGHEAGDRALQVVAAALQRLTSVGAFSGRMGGDEFAIYIPHSTYEASKLIASTVNSAVRAQYISVGPEKINCTMSIGIAADSPHEVLSSVLERADRALYAAKRRGRNCAVHERDLDGVSQAA